MFLCCMIHLYIYRRYSMNVTELEFCQMVEEKVDKYDSYIQAVIHCCEEFNIDVAFGAKLLSQPLIEKIQREGEGANLLPKISKLPV